MVRFDVIIVLGAAVWEGYQPSPSLHRRVLYAVKLFEERLADTILMTGGLGKFPPAEAILMRSLAVQHGVPRSNIFVEDESSSTFESILNCIEIMRRQGWKKAMVVTDSFHVFRSVYTLRSFGIDALGSAPTEGKEDTKKWKWVYYSLREIFAFPYYVALVWFEKLRIHHNKKH